MHRPRRLDQDDCTALDGVPVTTVARTLLDLAEVVGLADLDRATEQAERIGIFDLDQMNRLLGRSRGRRGLRPLRVVLARQAPETMSARSELERAFLRLCREGSIPVPSINIWIEGYEVDAAWPRARLVVELDGFEYHRTRAAFERDRLRDAQLQAAGFSVIRLTDQRLRTDRDGVVGSLRRMLGLDQATVQ